MNKGNKKHNINTLFYKPVELYHYDPIGTSTPKGDTFYSIRDGNWNDINTWETISGRNGKIPSENDDVVIRHNILCTGQSTSYFCNNLKINSLTSLTISTPSGPGTSLKVKGNIISLGILSIGLNAVFTLEGDENRIDALVHTKGIFEYSGNRDQSILDLPYYNLKISGSSFGGVVKKQISNLNVYSLTLSSNFIIFDSGSYDLTIETMFYILGTANENSAFYKSSGKVLIKGLFNFHSASNFRIVTSDSVIMEFQNGITVVNTINILMSTSNSKWLFTTNNQTISFGNLMRWEIDAEVVIDNIELTSGNSNVLLNINNVINGSTLSSKLINRGVIYFTTQYAAENSLTVGTFDFITNDNTIGFIGNYNLLIPSRFNNFRSLSLGSSTSAALNTKTLSTNITAENVYIGTLTTVQLDIYNLLGVPNISIGTSPIIRSNAVVNLVIGNLTQIFNGLQILLINGSSFEIRGSLIAHGGANNSSYSGFTDILLSTLNKVTTGGNGGSLWQNANIILANDIELTIDVAAGKLYSFINGSNSNSKVINKGSLTIKGPNMIMPIGILDCSTYPNTLTYNTGNQEIKGGTYNNLTFSGSGVKKLMGNIVVTGTYTLVPPATVNLNGFTIT